MASIAINPINTGINKNHINMDLSDYVTKDQLTNIYNYKGSVDTYADLPTENLKPGDVWNVENEYVSIIDDKHYPAGTNWLWNGSEWDAQGGSYPDLDIINKNIESNRTAISNQQQTIDLLTKTKAPKVGYAPDLKVDFAKELVGRGVAEPQEIGTIRPTGIISIGDGNATIEKVKGISVVWNQWYKTNVYSNQISGITFMREGYKWRINGVAEKQVDFNLFSSGLPIIVGHKYISLGSTTNVKIRDSWWEHFESDTLFECKRGDKWSPSLRILEGAEIRDELVIPRLIDLTQMFGAGNEPTTIEEFEARKPLGVSDDYNEGEIISYDAKELKSIGFNAWDEEWEVGGLSNGEPTNTITQIRSKNYTPCVGGQDYYGYMGWSTNDFLHLSLYDKDKVHIGNVGINRKVVTLPTNASYFKVFTLHECGYGNVYKGDICVNLSHSGYRNGEYKSYEADTLQLPNIKSIKDKDGNQLFPYGLLSDGNVHDEITATKAVKRIGAIALSGSENWTLQSINSNRFANFLLLITHRPNSIGLCNKFLRDTLSIASVTREGFLLAAGHALYIRIKSSTADTVEKFKEWLRNNPTTVHYELAEPIEVNLPEPLNLTYDAWDFGTEELIAEGKTTPLNADIVYQFNAVDRIRENTTNISEIEEEVATKQQELTLTVLDNGNIRIGNLQGQTKDFMPATPSSDPMHYAYITAGALYNDTDEPISRLAPWETEEFWEKNADGTYTYWEEDAYVQHLPRHWYLNGLGDITNEQMKAIYDKKEAVYNLSKPRYLQNSSVRTIIPIQYIIHSNQVIGAMGFAYVIADSEIEILCHNRSVGFFTTGFDIETFLTNNNAIGSFSGSKKLKILQRINIKNSPNNIFKRCESLECVQIIGANKDVSLENSPKIWKLSVKYLVMNCSPTTAITITLHPDAYARIVNQPDIIEALETKNAELASTGGSIALVSA